LRPYSTFAEVIQRLKTNNPRITDERAAFLARHWAEQMPDGSIRLRPIPLPQDGESGAIPSRGSHGLLAAHYRPNALAVGRRRMDDAVDEGRQVRYWTATGPAIGSLQELTIADAGHMMHHDQPERFAHAVEIFPAGLNLRPAIELEGLEFAAEPGRRADNNFNREESDMNRATWYRLFSGLLLAGSGLLAGPRSPDLWRRSTQSRIVVTMR